MTLPDGSRLEAHSGLGGRADDPKFVREPMRGPTPPALYELAYRESPFHGVRALRLNPVSGDVFGRKGLLAHTYMLGGRPESNGCVVFRDYDAFLKAFSEGRVKRLLVVPGRPAAVRTASSRPPPSPARPAASRTMAAWHRPPPAASSRDLLG